MANRVVKGEILQSRSLAKVSREAANVFMRLVLAVDEFGRIDGRWRVIWGALYGDREDTTIEEVRGWVRELCEEGCCDWYETPKGPVLRLPSFEKHRHARNRASKSKFPCRCGELGACECSPSLETERNGKNRLGFGFGFGSGFGSGSQPEEPAGDRAASKRVKRSQSEPSEDAQRLTGLLVAMVEEAGPEGTRVQERTWQREMDRMLRLDGRSPPEVQAVIEWLRVENPRREAPFVVLSAKSLRAKYDRIRAQMRSRPVGGQRNAGRRQTTLEAAIELGWVEDPNARG